MAHIPIRVDEDVARKVRRIVEEKYGGKRGALSMVVEGALRQLVSPPAEISASTLLAVIDYVSRAARTDSRSSICLQTCSSYSTGNSSRASSGEPRIRRRGGSTESRGEDPVEFLRKLTSSH